MGCAGRRERVTIATRLLWAAAGLLWPVRAVGAGLGGPDAAPPAVERWRDSATGVEFVRVPGGEFDMGSAANANEQPVHRVRVSSFWLARSELTQEQWRQVMGTQPSAHRTCGACPVERVSWLDVQKYLDRTGYRLPTEAEWEYAASGGAAGQRWAGTDDVTALGNYAWTRQNAQRKSHPVCGKRENAFGLCDMTGNVYEWCSDFYDAGYYGASPHVDPQGPAASRLRVARGGSWVLDPAMTKVTLRLSSTPSAHHSYIGFRPALSELPTGAVR